MYEVFNTKTGATRCYVRRKFVALLLARMSGRFFDYAPYGEGWIL